jgi:hypothetical protein
MFASILARDGGKRGEGRRSWRRGVIEMGFRKMHYTREASVPTECGKYEKLVLHDEVLGLPTEDLDEYAKQRVSSWQS